MALVNYYTDPNTGNSVYIYTGVTLTGNDLAANTNFKEIADGLSYVYNSFLAVNGSNLMEGDLNLNGFDLVLGGGSIEGLNTIVFGSEGAIGDDGSGGMTFYGSNAAAPDGIDSSGNLYLGGANINMGDSATATTGGGNLLMAGGSIEMSGGMIGTSGDTLSFFGKSGAVGQQTAPTAVATTTPTTGAYGFTLAQAQAIIAAVNQLITNGHNLGLTT